MCTYLKASRDMSGNHNHLIDNSFNEKLWNEIALFGRCRNWQKITIQYSRSFATTFTRILTIGQG